MKQLRAIRILFAALFLAACTACLVIGPNVHPMARAAQTLQISLAASSVALGVTAFWLVVTFLFGRLYCASVCPIGIISDLFLGVRRAIPRLNLPFRYRHPSHIGRNLLWVYVLSVIFGISIVVFIIEPYNMARNIAAMANTQAIASTWGTVGRGAVTGIAIGILSLLFIAISSIWHGREFCSRFCPLGTALGFVQEHARMHIEIDPDRCDSCGICEDRCRTQSIKVVSRYVDQTRCVRCFDCVADCPRGAIRYQLNKNRPASPLMRKAGSK